MLEIDLHGLTPHQALEEFITVYNRENKNWMSDSINVIHGYGSSGEGGKIKTLLRSYLKRYEQCFREVIPGELQDGNPGYKTIFPRTALPGMEEMLAEEVLVFCRTRKSEEKLTGEFRDYGGPLVKRVLRQLVSGKKIAISWKRRYKIYQSIS